MALFHFTVDQTKRSEGQSAIASAAYERQGVDLLPTIHEGATVRAMEKKGIRTEKGEFNRWIKATNALIREVRNKINALVGWIAEMKAELAWKELKAQKVTSVLILVAIILSTVMTTVVGQSIGILQSMRINQAASLNGDRYVTFHQLSQEQAQFRPCPTRRKAALYR